MHAGASRHPVRLARLPVAALGLDRAVGAVAHRRPAAPGRDDDARHRSSAPVRDRRRELPHRLRRLGLRARPRGRPVEDVARPVVDRCARSASGERQLVPAAPLRRRCARDGSSVRREPHSLPCRDRLPRAAHDAGGAPSGWPTRDSSAAPRSVDAVRRRVRSTRAVRHARAVDHDVRRRASGRASD